MEIKVVKHHYLFELEKIKKLLDLSESNYLLIEVSNETVVEPRVAEKVNSPIIKTRAILAAANAHTEGKILLTKIDTDASVDGYVCPNPPGY